MKNRDEKACNRKKGLLREGLSLFFCVQ